MDNVRKLLRPGGRLVLIELTGLAAASNTIFGTLEGWWMSEDDRKDGTLLTVPQWDALLKQHDFSGTDLAIPAHLQCGPSSHLSNMIVTTATVPVARKDETNGAPKVEMKASIHLGYAEFPQQRTLGDEICHLLGREGIASSRQSWDTIATDDVDRLLVVIDSAEIIF